MARWPRMLALDSCLSFRPAGEVGVKHLGPLPVFGMVDSKLSEQRPEPKFQMNGFVRILNEFEAG